ncbi:MAG: membrane dipeptidase [Acidobacteria bacterium RIFCSPLOWO2_12_FULL_67_14b]|nr:MAG: membrane dipeptidase [Acidobacteria bacterium RIFCSPLOWO2_12_FULL_67_14b]
MDAQGDLLQRARALHKQVPLIDGHNDYPWALRSVDPGRDLATADITRPVPSLMTDIPRLRQGGVGGQFWSVYVPSTMQGKEAVRATLEQIDIVHRMTRRWPETFELALTAADVERAFKAGRIGSLIGMEGGHSIDSSLATLRMMYALGARYMTITHSANLPWADASTDTPVLGGLSKFGEEVIREMNRMGMLVDLSHVSADTMADAIRVSAAPVIFSHSSARAICNVPRNVPDTVLQMVAKNGGVVMVTFVPGFISQAVADYDARLTTQRQMLRSEFPNNEAYVNVGLERWRAQNPEPKATLSQAADHIDHMRKVAGIDHIGLGGDFDGITAVVVGLEDVSTYPALTAELLKRGYKDDDIRKILGLNVLRVMKHAEKVAAGLQRTRQPSAATIEQLDVK